MQCFAQHRHTIHVPSLPSPANGYMSPTPLLPLLLLITFWASLHIARRFLPLPSPSLPLHTRRARGTDITLSYLTLRIESRALNSAHDRLAKYLAKPSHGRWLALGRAVYDLGAVVGVLGVGASVGLTAWTGVVLLGENIGRVHEGGGGVGRVLRRALEKLGEAASSRPTLALRPIIPGLTVPLTHLPLLLLALFTTQSLHELGHFLCAALDSLPLHSIGLALHLFVPTAFVSLSPPSSPTPPSPQVRIRLASAGAWHNILIYTFLYLLARSGAPQRTGWTDVRALGRVVLGFAEGETELTAYIPRGALITRLDDTPLGDGGEGGDAWEGFLLGGWGEGEKGWCVDKAWYEAQPTGCCSSPASSSPLSCFLPSPFPSLSASTTPGHCIPPLTLFNLSSPAPRCSPNPNPRSCAEGETCVRPAPEAQLLRITFVDLSRGGRERVVLWKGPRAEVFRQVRVGRWFPRAGVPLWAGETCELLYAYTLAVTLALYVFNLLPLPGLDGGEVLGAMLDWAFPPTPSASSASTSSSGSYELVERGSESGSYELVERGGGWDRDRAGGGGGGGGRWRERLERGVHWGVGALVGGVGVGVVLSEVWR